MLLHGGRARGCYGNDGAFPLTRVEVKGHLGKFRFRFRDLVCCGPALLCRALLKERFRSPVVSQSRSRSAAGVMAASTAAGKQRIPKVAKVGDREEPPNSNCRVGHQRQRSLCHGSRRLVVSEVAQGLVTPSSSRFCPVFVPELQSIGSVRFGSVNCLLFWSLGIPLLLPRAIKLEKGRNGNPDGCSPVP